MSALKRKIDGKLFKKASLSLCLFEEGWSFELFGLFIPTRLLRYREPNDMMESWGITLYERTIHLNWGTKTRVVHLPWEWSHVKHEVRRHDGSWVPYVGSYETSKEPDGRWEGTYSYVYTLKSGEVQERSATVYVCRREWRWRWIMWLPWPRIKRQSIDVTFDDEVGERTGSWKGGTIGCGYDMRPNESPLDALRRMEADRKF